ncbi:MAG: RNA 2',3'-cyclic phosphodiesterase [Kiritimatiellae bacterium]|nr:RNA 2',3'-cyclic phosphodiesterase [Kiritimatiellia bacterium]
MKFEIGNSAEANVLRTFVALEITDQVRASLAEVQARLKAAGGKVSWVPAGNIHLSLAFLGNIFETVVVPLGEALDRVAESIKPFSLDVAGVGYFGSPKRPRVIWAGIEAPPAELDRLYAGVCAAVRAFDIPLEERPFKAHLTLGRVKAPHNVGALTSAMGTVKNTRHGSVDVRRLLLMRSQLDPQGARYSVLHESTLKGA